MKLSINVKIIIIFFLTFVIISSFMVPIIIKIFSDDYISHEKEIMVERLSQFRKSVDYIIDNLDFTTNDWATWDDLYNFTKKQNNSFVEENLYSGAVEKLGIHLFMVIDNTGQIIYSTCFDDKNFEKVRTDDTIHNFFLSGEKIIGLNSKVNIVKGVMSFKGNMLLFASRPILKNKADGAPAGALIMGKFFKGDILKQIHRLTSLNVDLIDIETLANMKGNYNIFEIIKSEGAYIEIKDEVINGYSFLKDPYDKPAHGFKISRALIIYKRGFYVVRYFITVYFLIIVVSLFAGFFFIKKLFIERLLTIHSKIKASYNHEIELKLPVDGDDEISELAVEMNTMLVKISTTINELEDSRELLKRKVDEANSANRLKSRFLAVMSHEIRTPMNSVIGFCEMLNKTNLNFEQKKMLNNVRTSGKLLNNLLNNLLDFSKIEANKITIDNIEFSLLNIIFEVNESMLISAQNKNNELVCNVDPKMAYYLFGDPLRIRQVILNLVSNAIKFTENGNVNICVDVLSETDLESKVKISVKDNGIGIKKENHAKIFSPFVQAEDAIVRKFGGTGLGLAISNELVKLMGGEKIILESAEGAGSDFYFIINFKKGALFSEKELINSSNELIKELHITNNMRILYADDDLLNRELGYKLLLSAGFDVCVVNNGKEALAKVESEKYNIVLLDVQMPEVDGIEAARIMRKNGISLPIIAVTASVTYETRVECFDAGMNSIISKPLNVDAFLKEISGFLLAPPDNNGKCFAQNDSARSEKVDFYESARAGNDKVNAFIDEDEPYICNYKKALQNMGGNKQLLDKVIVRFFESQKQYLRDFDNAFSNNDVKKLGFNAHKLKGLLLTIGAQRLVELLLKLEAMGKKGDISHAGELIEEVKTEIALYSEKIKKIMKAS